MQTAAEQIKTLRGHYSNASVFTHEGVDVRVVAYVMWTDKKNKEHWVFKLSTRRIVRVDYE